MLFRAHPLWEASLWRPVAHPPLANGTSVRSEALRKTLTTTERDSMVPESINTSVKK